MTDIAATRRDLLAWAKKKPEPVRACARIIAENLKLLVTEPDDESVTKVMEVIGGNVARLEAAVLLPRKCD